MQIAVIGSGAEWTAQAEDVGRLLAGRGCVVVCGGLGEVMAAAARGAKEAGGTTVGILPGETVGDANPWIDYAVATGTGHARNLAVVASCEAIAYARLLDRPVVVLGPGPGVEGDGIGCAETPAEAVELVLGLVEAR